MSVSCPSLWSTLGRTVFSVLDRDLKRFIFLISHAGQHSVLCCTPRFLRPPPVLLMPQAYTPTLTYAYPL